MGDMKGFGYSSEDSRSDEKRRKRKRIRDRKISERVRTYQDLPLLNMPKMLGFSMSLEIGRDEEKRGKRRGSRVHFSFRICRKG